MENTEDCSSNFLKLLIRTRLDLEPEFQEGKKKKSFLWEFIFQLMKEKQPNLNMTKDQMTRKFSNLLITYRRIKHRSNSTGRDTTAWEFFQDFDEVYGERYSINPQLEYLQSSLSCIIDETQDSSNDSNTHSETLYHSHNASSRKRRKVVENNEMLDFLKQKEQREQERHNEIVDLKRQQIALDKDKIKAMEAIKDVLHKLIDKAYTSK